MDPALLRQQEAFKRRAMALPVVESKSKKEKPSSIGSVKTFRPPKVSKSKDKPRVQSNFDYKTHQGSSGQMSIMARIVQYLKKRHQEGDLEPMPLEEILDEMEETVNARVHSYLTADALPANPKIEVIDGEYRFKPPLDIRTKKELLRKLEEVYRNGEGGLERPDVEESVLNCAKAFKLLGDKITFVSKPSEKKQIVYFRDRSHDYEVCEDIQKLWRGVSLDGVDERKITEYLQRHNITAVKEVVTRKAPMPKQKSRGKKKPRAYKTHNEHVGDILQDYSKAD